MKSLSQIPLLTSIVLMTGCAYHSGYYSNPYARFYPPVSYSVAVSTTYPVYPVYPSTYIHIEKPLRYTAPRHPLHHSAKPYQSHRPSTRPYADRQHYRGNKHDRFLSPKPLRPQNAYSTNTANRQPHYNSNPHHPSSRPPHKTTLRRYTKR